MEIKAKIGFTLIFILGFFLLKTISKWNNKRLKKRLEIINPKLIAKSQWFFSDTKQNVLNYLIGIMTFIFLLLMWTGFIVIPAK